MGLMPTMPRSRPLTLEDFEEIRDVDDGHRYELIDGVLVVTPSPVPVHQRVVTRLSQTLSSGAPVGHEVFVAPLDIRLAADTVVQPDILAVTAASITERRIEGPPVLAVEVLSPSTRHFDLSLKHARYEAAGCPNYWVVDPHEPRIRCWHLTGEGYQLVADASGDQVIVLTEPWQVTISASDLIRP